MYFSPQAMSQNGRAALKHAEHERRAPAARSSVVAQETPFVTKRNASSISPATSARTHIITEGSRSSTATLMKKYELPQSAERRSRSGR